MSDQLGVFIVGCGYWGINYIRVFSELPQSRVVGVCDRQPDRLQEVSRRFPGVELTTQVEDGLCLDGVDAAVVCTEATAHHNVTHRFLSAGKHVLVEKPMTTTVADAEELMALAQSQGVTLMVGHTFLYNAGIRKVKAYIEQAEVGQVYYLYARRTNLGPIRRDVNALWDLAPHDVSIFNYLLDGVPEWASAVGAKVLRNCREDVGFISLGYPNEIVGHVHVSWADPNKVREVVVVGSDKRIVFNDLSALERVRVFEKGIMPAAPEAASYGEYHFLMRDGDIISPRIEVSEPLKNQCRHFVECATGDSCPLTDGRDGLDVVRVMEAVDRSMALNGAPVEIA
jgi:predicted dehydrogenase